MSIYKKEKGKLEKIAARELIGRASTNRSVLPYRNLL